MGGLFGGKKVSTPKVQKVSPPPAVTSEMADTAMAGAGKGGFESTFITGDLVPPTKRKTVLG